MQISDFYHSLCPWKRVGLYSYHTLHPYILINISKLNSEIKQMEVGDKISANDLRDKRESLLLSLSNLVDIDYYDDQYGMLTIRGPGESTLLEGTKAISFSVRVNGGNA